MGYRVFCAGAVLAAAVVIAASTTEARAGDGFVDEIKLGVLDHDIGLFGDSVENGVDVNAEVRFHSIDWLKSKDNAAWINDILAPRPDIGATINTSGNTDFYYAGLTWTWDFANDIFQPKDGFYGDFGFGGAIHDGYDENAPPGEKNFGSRALFHLSGELGYRINEQMSLSVYYEHFSNAGLAHSNPGLNDLGVRFGYRF